MASYPVYEAKARLSELLRQEKARRDGIISERGKRIARLVCKRASNPSASISYIFDMTSWSLE